MKRNVLNVVVILALCLVGISACGSKSPTAPPTIAPALSPTTALIKVGDVKQFTVSDPKAVCTAPVNDGILKQNGANLEYTGLKHGKYAISCEKDGAIGTASVTVKRDAVIRYRRPAGMTFQVDALTVVIRTLVNKGVAGWEITNYLTERFQDAQGYYWEAKLELQPGTHYIAARDSNRQCGVVDNIDVWGVPATKVESNTEVCGVYVKIEIGDDYNLK